MANKLSKGFSSAVIVIIIAVILAGVVGFVMTRRPSTSTPSGAMERSSGSSETAASTGETTSTFTDVVGRGQNLECDWRLPSGSGENPFGAGKLYTTANKGRSMITGNSNGVTIDGNAVYKDNEVYSWITVAGTTMGFKFSQSELESMNSSMTAEQRQQAEQIRSEMIFACRPWTPDESKFTLPAGVSFE